MGVSMQKTGIGWYVSAPEGFPFAGRSFARVADAQAAYAEWRRIERGVCAECGDSIADAQRHICEP